MKFWLARPQPDAVLTTTQTFGRNVSNDTFSPSRFVASVLAANKAQGRGACEGASGVIGVIGVIGVSGERRRVSEVPNSKREVAFLMRSD